MFYMAISDAKFGPKGPGIPPIIGQEDDLYIIPTT